MTREVLTVTPDTTLQDAAVEMRAHDIGFLPVVDSTGPIGAFTDRDLALRGVGRGLDPSTALVSEIMTPNVAILLETQDAAAAMQLMRDRRVRRLVVVGDDNQVTGVLSVGDLVNRELPMDAVAELLRALAR